uniref:Uncharacterized protein n=1 Tax=Anopheles culicifacies TaxID=139723 RepID=A0A182M586_9DIPT
MPALFTSTSTPPNVSRIRWNVCTMSASTDTSHFMACSRAAAAFGMLCFSCSTRSTRRAKPMVIIPALARSSAIAAPIPELAPVTTATLEKGTPQNAIPNRHSLARMHLVLLYEPFCMSDF